MCHSLLVRRPGIGGEIVTLLKAGYQSLCGSLARKGIKCVDI